MRPRAPAAAAIAYHPPRPLQHRSMERLVTIIGGAGLVGAALVEQLAHRGWRMRITCRTLARAHRLKPLADIGQIAFAAADVGEPRSLGPALRDSEAVINLAGVQDADADDLAAVNAAGAGHVAAAAAALGSRALIHVSALGAAPGSRSAFARSKAAGEEAVRAAFPAAAIVRPAPIFGPEDDFTNRFARLLALSPVMPVIAPDARLQPVFVCDVADAIAAILERQVEEDMAGPFELAGPDAMTMRDFLRAIAAASGHQRRLIDAPDFGARMLAGPATGVGADELALLMDGLVASGNAPGLRELGIIPTPLGGVAEEWLCRYRPGGRFATAA